MTMNSVLRVLLFTSASPNGRAKDVRVCPVVVPKLKLVNVQLKVFLADLVERADDAALNDAPEPFDGVRVNRASNVLSATMTNDAVRVVVAQMPVCRPFIGRDQADFGGHSLTHKVIKRCRVGTGYDSRNHVALALHGTGHDGLALLVPRPEPEPPGPFPPCLFSPLPPM